MASTFFDSNDFLARTVQRRAKFLILDNLDIDIICATRILWWEALRMESFCDSSLQSTTFEKDYFLVIVMIHRADNKYKKKVKKVKKVSITHHHSTARLY